LTESAVTGNRRTRKENLVGAIGYNRFGAKGNNYASEDAR